MSGREKVPALRDLFCLVFVICLLRQRWQLHLARRRLWWQQHGTVAANRLSELEELDIGRFLATGGSSAPSIAHLRQIVMILAMNSLAGVERQDMCFQLELHD